MFFKELYQYRYLMREIVAKNIKIQYRDSVLGILWTLLQPFLTTLVLVFIFGRLFGSNDPRIINFPIYVLCGRLLFEFYSQSTKRAMRSVTGSASVIKKVKVPKHIYPIANVLSNFITFLISLLVLVGFCIFYSVVNTKYSPPVLNWHILLAPVPLIILFFLCTGVGLILSTLAVFFKDVEYLYDVFCLLLFYCTPVFFTIERLNGDSMMTNMLKANPLYHIIEMFRDCVLRGAMFNMTNFYYSLAFAAVMLVIGGIMFRKKEKRFILYI